MKLIDKNALVAEIENLRKHYIIRDDFDIGWNKALDKILSLIDTLEVKEVDLREEIDVYFQRNKNGYNGLLICKKEDFSVIAKHFFELGLKAMKGEKV